MSTKCEEWRAKRSAAPPLALHNHALLSLLYLPLRTSHFAPRTALYFPFSATHLAPRTSHLALRTNPNVVGYGGFATEENRAPVLGAMFFDVGGAKTYDLSMLTVPEFYDEEGELADYADPGTEYLRVLDPNSSATTARYCYISYGYLLDNVDEPDESKWAIGWWNYDGKADYCELINGKDSTLQVKSAVPIDNGTAFLGNFDPNHSIRLQSSGEVVTKVTGIATGENRAPMINNFLPVDIDLADITIPEVYDEEGELADYADPGTEYLRVLDPNSSATTARYCYISYGYLLDNVDEPDESLWAIGWWNYDGKADYCELINGKDDALQVKEAIPVQAGTGFLGNFDPNHSIDVLFPSAIDVPSKK